MNDDASTCNVNDLEKECVKHCKEINTQHFTVKLKERKVVSMACNIFSRVKTFNL